VPWLPSYYTENNAEANERVVAVIRPIKPAVKERKAISGTPAAKSEVNRSSGVMQRKAAAGASMRFGLTLSSTIFSYLLAVWLDLGTEPRWMTFSRIMGLLSGLTDERTS
jgi:hypothetical protein